MAEKNLQPFTPEGVLAYIMTNRGIRYQCSQLARTFRVKPTEMRDIILIIHELKLVSSNVVGKYRYYFLPTQAEIDLANRMKEKKEFKPLRKEFMLNPYGRDENAEFWRNLPSKG